jgi:hypothetical protein
MLGIDNFVDGARYLEAIRNFFPYVDTMSPAFAENMSK